MNYLHGNAVQLQHGNWQLFTLTTAIVATVLRRPLQLWRYSSIFISFSFFKIQCVLMVSLYQTGGNLW